MQDFENQKPEYRPKQKNYGVCGFWTLMLLLIVIGGLIFAVVYLVTKTEDKSTDSDVSTTITAPDTGVCETPECIVLAASLLDKTDQSIKPCDNFYQFACGTWLQKTAITVESGDVSIASELKNELDRNLKYVLESPETHTEPEATKKAKSLYRACMDKDKREINGISGLLNNAENDLGGWPILEGQPGGNFDDNAFDLTDLLIKLVTKYASTSFIHAVASEDQTDPEKFHLLIQAGIVTKLKKDFYLLDDVKYGMYKQAYIQYMTDIAVAFGTTDERNTNLECQAVVDLETDLAQAKADSTPTPTPTQVMSVADMQNMYPEIHWIEYLEAILPDGTEPVTANFTLINQDSEYLRAALNIIADKPPRLIADWLLWLCFEDYALYLTDKVRDIYYNYEKLVTGKQAPNQYFQDCVKVTDTNLATATGRLFVDKFFAGESKTLVEEMAADIVKVVVDLVAQSDRFDSQAKQQASKQLNDMLINVGYPDFILNNAELDKGYQDLEIPDDNALVAVARAKVWRIKQNLALLKEADFSEEYLSWSDLLINRVNADYQIDDNSMILQVGILQPPFFNKDYPWYINYANIGMVIAQITSNVFATIGDYAEVDECVKTQYSEFKLDDMPVNVDQTNTNDVADNFGLQAAIQGFMQKKQEEETRMLPGVNMSAEKLFFLSNTQIWCEKFSPESVQYYLDKLIRSPGEFRTTGMLQNSAYFADVFECPAGSYMNPTDKCNIW